jgi:hypothetical protein
MGQPRFALPQGLFRFLPLDRRCQHVGHRLQEMNVILGEGVRLGGERAEHAKRRARPGDGNAGATHDTVIPQQRLGPEPRFPVQVLGHDRLAASHRKRRHRGTLGSHNGVSDQVLPPPDAGSQNEHVPIAAPLQNLRELNIQCFRDEARRFLEQETYIAVRKRFLPQARDRGLLPYSRP